MTAMKIDLEKLKTKKLAALALALSTANATKEALTTAFADWLKGVAGAYPPAVGQRLAWLIGEWNTAGKGVAAKLKELSDRPGKPSRAELMEMLPLLEKFGEQQANQDDAFRVALGVFATDLPADEETKLCQGRDRWTAEVNQVMDAMNAEILRITGLPPVGTKKTTFH